jgi:uncharacterized membrane protein
MTRDRLTAFTDGVLAVIITIMVLEMQPPHGAHFSDLAAVYPVFLSYILSFIYIAIYWNNHHHFFHLVRTVDGGILWANMLLLFWLSVVPFATAWMGENDFAAAPTALYGVALLMPAVAWHVMQGVIVRRQGPNSPLGQALGGDLKGKVSLLIYVAGIGLSFVSPLGAQFMYWLVAVMWLIPDRRVEAVLLQTGHAAKKTDAAPRS